MKIPFSAKNLGGGVFVLLGSYTAAAAQELITRVRFDTLAGDGQYEVRLAIVESSTERECMGGRWFMDDTAEGRYVHSCELVLDAGETLKVYARNFADTGDSAVSGSIYFHNKTVSLADAISAASAAAVLATPGNKLSTDAAGQVTANNMRGTDAALLAANYTAPANADIAAVKAKTDNLPAAPVGVSDFPTLAEFVNNYMTTTHGAGSWTTGAGSGDVLVNHDYGRENELAATIDGVGVDGVIIRAYLATDYAAGSFVIRGETVTDSAGGWITPMMLDAGDYILLYSKPGEFREATKEITVTV